MKKKLEFSFLMLSTKCLYNEILRYISFSFLFPSSGHPLRARVSAYVCVCVCVCMRVCVCETKTVFQINIRYNVSHLEMKKC